MSESATPKFGVMQWGAGVVALQSTPLPVLYFDSAPSISHLNGVIGITLTVTGGAPTKNGGVDTVAAVAAYLKCNVPAAISLRAALDQAILLAQPVDNPSGKAN
jgi:hypothetical protein